MFTLIIGGSGSGKSAFAENLAMTYNQKPYIYIATMLSFDQETKDKILRHKKMRQDKRFQTIECFTGLNNITVPKSSTVLLDCMSNLLANEMFQKGGAKEHSVTRIMDGIIALEKQCSNLIVVTNEIFLDGCIYEEDTKEYMEALGTINRNMAGEAKKVIEVVCGIPILTKTVV